MWHHNIVGASNVCVKIINIDYSIQTVLKSVYYLLKAIVIHNYKCISNFKKPKVFFIPIRILL